MKQVYDKIIINGNYDTINNAIIKSNNFDEIKYLMSNSKYRNIFLKANIEDATIYLDEEIMYYLCENKIIYVPDKIYDITKALIDTNRVDQIPNYIKYISEYSLQEDIDKIMNILFIDVFESKLKQLFKKERKNEEDWEYLFKRKWKEKFGYTSKYEFSNNQKHKLYKLTYLYMKVMNKADATIDNKLDYSCIGYLIELYKIANINTNKFVKQLFKIDINYMKDDIITVMIDFFKTRDISGFELPLEKLIWLYENRINITNNINNKNKDDLFNLAINTKRDDLAILVYNIDLNNTPNVNKEILLKVYQTMPDLALILSRCEQLAKRYTFHTHMDLASQYGLFNIVQEILRDEPFSINYYESLLDIAINSNNQQWSDNILTMRELLF